MKEETDCFFLGLVSLFNGINFCGLFNAKAILGEEQQWYDLTHSCGGEDLLQGHSPSL